MEKIEKFLYFQGETSGIAYVIPEENEVCIEPACCGRLLIKDALAGAKAFFDKFGSEFVQEFAAKDNRADLYTDESGDTWSYRKRSGMSGCLDFQVSKQVWRRKSDQNGVIKYRFWEKVGPIHVTMSGYVDETIRIPFDELGYGFVEIASKVFFYRHNFDPSRFRTWEKEAEYVSFSEGYDYEGEPVQVVEKVPIYRHNSNLVALERAEYIKELGCAIISIPGEGERLVEISDETASKLNPCNPEEIVANPLLWEEIRMESDFQPDPEKWAEFTKNSIIEFEALGRNVKISVVSDWHRDVSHPSIYLDGDRTALIFTGLYLVEDVITKEHGLSVYFIKDWIDNCPYPEWRYFLEYYKNSAVRGVYHNDTVYLVMVCRENDKAFVRNMRTQQLFEGTIKEAQSKFAFLFSDELKNQLALNE